MKQLLQHYLPALIPIAVLLAMVFVLLEHSSVTEDGIPVYPQDDAYIHMTLARNFADHGSWSITGEGVQGASSSLSWTLLLAGLFRIGAPQEITPLVLNIVIGVLAILAVFYAGGRRQWPVYLQVLVAVGVVLGCPLFSNVVVGMEQTLHVLLMLLLFTFAGELLAAGRGQSSFKLLLPTMLLAAAATSIRYESSFLIFATCLVLAWQRRWWSAFALAVAGAAPLGIYAIFSVAHGAMPVPTSVMTKGVGTVSALNRLAKLFFVFAVLHLVHAPYMLALMLAVAVSFFAYRQYRNRSATPPALPALPVQDGGYLFTIWMIAAWIFLDLTFGDSFFRYDSYLIALGLFLIADLWAPRLMRRRESAENSLFKCSPIGALTIAAMLALVGFLGVRSVRAAVKGPLASQNIQQQQYQMARFLRDYYPGVSVGINDIGAVSYFAHSKIVDLWGLASTKVAKAILMQAYDTKAIQRICEEEDIRIAVVYTIIYTRYGGLPDSWIPIASWTIPDNYICGDSTVTFYAVRPQEADSLRKNLIAFSAKLPPDVKFQLLESKGEAASDGASKR